MESISFHGIYSFHMDSMECIHSMWNMYIPYGIHVESIYMPDGIRGDSKVLRLCPVVRGQLVVDEELMLAKVGLSVCDLVT